MGVSDCELVNEKDEGIDNKEDLLVHDLSRGKLCLSLLFGALGNGWLNEYEICLFSCSFAANKYVSDVNFFMLLQIIVKIIYF